LTWIHALHSHPSHYLSQKVSNDYPWYIVLDAASHVTTTPIDLSRYPADFVAISFYKMFGFPTGVGALVVANHALSMLKNPYFGGGTVEAVSWDHPSFHVPKSDPAHLYQRFEEGTLPFFEILALEHGFNYIETVGGWSYVQLHTMTLAQQTRTKMAALTFTDSNGHEQALVEFYPKNSTKSFELGPIIAFNLRSFNGSYIGYTLVQKLASLHHIHLRVGCFCNPGACQTALNLTSEDIIQNHQRFNKKCGDGLDLIDGKPVGAIRISFGLSNTSEDCDKWIDFLKQFIRPLPRLNSLNAKDGSMTLASIFVVPFLNF
jgi:molybdenum cofactor sulfurtransferase